MGVIEWQNTIGGIGDDFGECVFQTNSGEFMVAGYSYSPISGDKTDSSANSDYWVLKLDTMGNIIWQKSIGGDDFETLYRGVIQDIDGGYIIAGSSTSGISGDKTEAGQGSSDYWIVKLAPDESGIGIENELQDNIEIVIFPNPASNYIRFISSQTECSEIHIYNSVGQTVSFSRNVDLNSSLILTQLVNGFYICELVFNNKQRVSQKILIQNY